MPVKNEFWTTPNQLTLLRLFFIPFINICVMERRYHTALILMVVAGLSDGLDGLAARLLHQQTKLGEYLDPIADKLLLSSLFLVMSSSRMIPWRYTVMVFSRDLGNPDYFGAAVHGRAAGLPSGHLRQDQHRMPDCGGILCAAGQGVSGHEWVWMTRQVLLYAVFAFTLASAIQYVFLTGHRLKKLQADK